MAKAKVEATVTLVMSLEEAAELYEVLGRTPSEVCSEVYLALGGAL